MPSARARSSAIATRVPTGRASATGLRLEDLIYIDPGEVGRGVGRLLLADLIERSAALGYRQMVAVIGGSETLPSINLHKALGFTHVGVLSGIGFKFGRWVDSVLMQRRLGPGNTNLPG